MTVHALCGQRHTLFTIICLQAVSGLLHKLHTTPQTRLLSILCYKPCLTVHGSTLQVAAERVAWEMAKEHGFHLCVINPTFVLGPVVSSRTDAASINIFRVCT